ncbi:unnamed protein product, partial [Allacma fusca]
MNYSLEKETPGNSDPFFFDEELDGNSLENSSNMTGFDPMVQHVEYIFDKGYVRVIFIGIYSIVFCLCFFGNLAVVLVVTLHPKMRSTTRFCLGNLAFANLCVGIFCVYQNLSTFLFDRWLFGSFLCKMYYFINSLSHTASILILVVICVERYLAILHPFKTRQWLTLMRLRVVIITVWILSAILCSPRLYYITTYYIPSTGPDGEELYEMICAPQQTLYDHHIFDIVYFILLYLLPLVGMSYLYTRVGIVLWHSSGLKRHPGQGPELNSLSMKVPLRSSIADSEPGSIRINQRQRKPVQVKRCARILAPGAHTRRVAVRHSNNSFEDSLGEEEDLGLRQKIRAPKCLSKSVPVLLENAQGKPSSPVRHVPGRDELTGTNFPNVTLKNIRQLDRSKSRDNSIRIYANGGKFQESVHVERNYENGGPEHSRISVSASCPEMSNCIESSENFLKSTKLAERKLSGSKELNNLRVDNKMKSLIKSRQAV